MKLEQISQNIGFKASEPIAFTEAENNMRSAFLQDKKIQDLKKSFKSMSDMNAFPELKYSLEHDTKQVLEARQKDQAKSMHSELLADIMAFRMNDYNWLGDECKITPTNEYDDRMNHADIVCEFTKPADTQEANSRQSYLAIDCTVSEDIDVLKKKTGYTARRFFHTEMLPEIKYIRKQVDNKPIIKNIPRVIVAIEKKRLDEVCKAMLPADNNSETAIRKIKTSYIQLYMLYQIVTQLRQQLVYVTQKFTSRAKMVQAYDSLNLAFETIRDIIQQKESSLGNEITERAWSEFEKSDVSAFLNSSDFSTASAEDQTFLRRT